MPISKRKQFKPRSRKPRMGGGRRSRKNTGNFQRGGMFNGNFQTYLGSVSPDAYYPFNTENGGANDPISPAAVHDSRLDEQVKTTPFLLGGGSTTKGKKTRKNKTRKNRRKMRGGSALSPLLSAGSSSTITDHPVFATMNTSNAPTLASLSTGTTPSFGSNLTFQPVNVITGSNTMTPLV